MIISQDQRFHFSKFITKSYHHDHHNSFFPFSISSSAAAAEAGAS
jgi:hypothetical protein